MLTIIPHQTLSLKFYGNVLNLKFYVVHYQHLCLDLGEIIDFSPNGVV